MNRFTLYNDYNVIDTLVNGTTGSIDYDLTTTSGWGTRWIQPDIATSSQGTGGIRRYWFGNTNLSPEPSRPLSIDGYDDSILCTEYHKVMPNEPEDDTDYIGDFLKEFKVKDVNDE